MKPENKKIIWNVLYIVSYIFIYLVIGGILQKVLFNKILNFDKNTSSFIKSIVGIGFYIVYIIVLYTTIYRRISIQKTFNTNLNTILNSSGSFVYTYLTINISKQNLSLWTKVLIHYVDSSREKVVITKEFLPYGLKSILGKRIRTATDEDILYLVYKLSEKNLVSSFINTSDFIKRDRFNKLKNIL